MDIHTYELPLDTRLNICLLLMLSVMGLCMRQPAPCPAAVLIVFPLCLQKVKFGYIKKSQKDFEEECLAIEEFEGKIHANIVDLSKYCEMAKVCMSVTKPRVATR